MASKKENIKKKTPKKELLQKDELKQELIHTTGYQPGDKFDEVNCGSINNPCKPPKPPQTNF